MSTLEHPLPQVPGLAGERLQVAVELPANPQWYRDMVRVNPTPTTRADIDQILGDDPDTGVFDAVWMLLALRGAKAGYALTLPPMKGTPLLGAMIEVQERRAGTSKDNEVWADAFRREVERGDRARTLTHVRKRLIDARRLTGSGRWGKPMAVCADRMVRDVYAALHPDRQVRVEFTRFILAEHYRYRAWAEAEARV